MQHPPVGEAQAAGKGEIQLLMHWLTSLPDGSPQLWGLHPWAANGWEAGDKWENAATEPSSLATPCWAPNPLPMAELSRAGRGSHLGIVEGQLILWTLEDAFTAIETSQGQSWWDSRAPWGAKLEFSVVFFSKSPVCLSFPHTRHFPLNKERD